MMRNLGGAVGIAVCGAILNDRTNFHFNAIAAHLTAANGALMRVVDVNALRYGVLASSPDFGHTAALKALWLLAYREALTLAFADAFRVIMLAFVVAVALVPVLRKSPLAVAPASSERRG
jgi:DHA2 family multidrug resistance protein